MTDRYSTPPEANEAFLELGKIVLGDKPLPQILEQVLRIALKALPCTHASITLVTDDEPSTVAFTSDEALALDERQYEVDRGPCLDSAASGDLIVVADMASDTRWEAFSERAQALGIRSSLSSPLPVQRQVLGALNFYSTETDTFDEQTVELAQTFAAHAAVALANAQLYESTALLAEQMQHAMATRAVIEQAKGIVMRDNSCSADEAFNLLVRMSQETHYKLREVAQMLVDQVSLKKGSRR
jgi:GAF domain-containing protein